jgi:hypothetical protein
MALLCSIAFIAIIIVLARVWFIVRGVDVPFGNDKQHRYSDYSAAEDAPWNEIETSSEARSEAKYNRAVASVVRRQNLRKLKESRQQLVDQIEHRYRESAYFTYPGKRRQYFRFACSMGLHCLVVRVHVSQDEWLEGAPVIAGKSFEEFIAAIPKQVQALPVHILPERVSYEQ